MSELTEPNQEARDSGHTVSWLVLFPLKDGSYQRHEASVSATGRRAITDMFEAIQTQWEALNPKITRVGHYMMLQKVAVDIVELLDVCFATFFPPVRCCC